MFEQWKSFWLYWLIILYFYEYCELIVNKSKNYEFWMTIPTADYKENNLEIAKIKHCYMHREQINRNNYN